MQRILAVTLSALFLICAAPAAPGKDLIPKDLVPFRSSGMVQLLDIPAAQGTSLVRAVDIGRATHLGNFTSTYLLSVNTDTPTWLFTGEFTSTASNGDTITFAIKASVSLATGEFTGEFRATGGTGRFKGISGGSIITSGIADLSSGSFFYESSGVIPSVGATKKNLR